ncbi:MAG: dihydroorotase [Treponema sp.]|nr:dihydroorotase [Treponema sp.]
MISNESPRGKPEPELRRGIKPDFQTARSETLKRLVLKKFRIIDDAADIFGTLVVEDGIIREIAAGFDDAGYSADMVIDGRGFGDGAVLMPAFVDLHAHFRDPGFPEKETLESASLAAAAAGYGTVVCMANTDPVIDTLEKARSLKERSNALGLIDLYPVLSLSKNMEGRELSGIKDLPAAGALPLMLSEDGKDLADDRLFFKAMGKARLLGIPVSCHCDFGGPEAEAAKAAGRPRAEWSRIEENNAVRRAIELGKQAGCHIHIAHVSTMEAAALIRNEKKSPPANPRFTLTCEATPHHIGAAEKDAARMGESRGRVNPPLRSEADRKAIAAAICDGTIDAIATDHAPHSEADKAAGAPGFSGLETAFAVCLSTLNIDLRRLSALMSANPARILGLYKGPGGRGRIAPGLRADLVIADTRTVWKVRPEQFKSRGKCSPFTDRELRGKILMTIRGGTVTFGGENGVK